MRPCLKRPRSCQIAQGDGLSKPLDKQGHNIGKSFLCQNTSPVAGPPQTNSSKMFKRLKVFFKAEASGCGVIFEGPPHNPDMKLGSVYPSEAISTTGQN